ncbi:unnamed protein product [Calypogeia fissa]
MVTGRVTPSTSTYFLKMKMGNVAAATSAMLSLSLSSRMLQVAAQIQDSSGSNDIQKGKDALGDGLSDAAYDCHTTFMGGSFSEAAAMTSAAVCRRSRRTRTARRPPSADRRQDTARAAPTYCSLLSRCLNVQNNMVQGNSTSPTP